MTPTDARSAGGDAVVDATGKLLDTATIYPHVPRREWERSLATLAGLALYGSAAFLYMVALRKIPISVAFPTVSLSYAIVAVVGHYLFCEPFGMKQIGGIALIVGGVVLINQT